MKIDTLDELITEIATNSDDWGLLCRKDMFNYSWDKYTPDWCAYHEGVDVYIYMGGGSLFPPTIGIGKDQAYIVISEDDYLYQLLRDVKVDGQDMAPFTVENAFMVEVTPGMAYGFATNYASRVMAWVFLLAEDERLIWE